MDLDGKTVLVTGGTGSFGHAFACHLHERFPNCTIRIFSRDELKQSEMAAEFPNHNLRFFIGDVRDRLRLNRAMSGVQIVIHAAAMKQVPACEYNPFEAVNTNVLGTQNVIDAAIDCGVEQVVELSTDKAVNPVNLYGATKLCAEKMIIQGNAYASGKSTRLSSVRYGNVVGSRGSVVPLFKQQAKNGVLEITDERMTRFWITLPQACDLVLFALENMDGGEVFVPKLPSMKVVDLAHAIAPEAEIRSVGIRPGEKLHELLTTSEQSYHTVDIGDAYVVIPEHPWWNTENSFADKYPRVPEGFVYSSDGNEDWLSIENLQELLK